VDQQTLLWILGGMQAVNLLLLGWIKLDNKSLWKRADCHGHVVRCENDGCEAETRAVIIPTAGGRG
jgi:hypothetical protein